MIRFLLLRLCVFLISGLLPLAVSGTADKLRAMWREDPATSMVIGWDQISGHSPVVYLDVVDYGQEYSRYRFSKTPDQVVVLKGMNNHFARFRGLQPNTVYYFVIRDSEGVSARYSFKTAPNNPRERLSIIAGGDSRNNREALQDANKLVAKLRPHVVLFNGDMTNTDSDEEWQEWLDDWELTIARDGRITPVLAARGNHEVTNTVLYVLFDLPSPDCYYALNLGGNLLRVYTLNSLIPAGGVQRDWLERDLSNNSSAAWKMVQYHYAIRPHTEKKPENGDQYFNWASLFYGFRVNIAIEADAHVTKITWPVRPSSESGSSEGFIRDDRNGTVYIGEGGWGAPLRECNDVKPWTRSSGSFHQFSWIFVDQDQIEIRTVRITDAETVMEVDPNNIFRTPAGLSIWNPSNGDVVVIRPQDTELLADEEPAENQRTEAFDIFQDGAVAAKLPNFAMQEFLTAGSDDGLVISLSTANEPPSMVFELQRSIDGGINFSTIAAFQGKGKPMNQYRHVDPNSGAGNGAIRYRIRRVFPNGESDHYFPNRSLQEDMDNFDNLPKLMPDPGTQQLKVAYTLDFQANVKIRLVNPAMREVIGIELPDQVPGKYLKTLDLTAVPPGRYLLVVRANYLPLRRYRVQK